MQAPQFSATFIFPVHSVGSKKDIAFNQQLDKVRKRLQPGEYAYVRPNHGEKPNLGMLLLKGIGRLITRKPIGLNVIRTESQVARTYQDLVLRTSCTGTHYYTDETLSDPALKQVVDQLLGKGEKLGLTLDTVESAIESATAAT